MKFFIDTANIDQIKEANSWGVLDGVTTNPSLVSKEGRDFKDLIKEITEIVDGPISAEVISEDHEGMLTEARELAKIHENITVKIPMTVEGMKAVKVLSGEEIKTNVTLCFSPVQALIAAKAGATFISPFIGRLDDINHYGMDLVESIIQIYENYGFPTEVIAASIRHPIHVLEAALVGSDIATVPFAILEKLFKHPLTDRGIEKFMADWKKLKK